jgi:hypothetical protein
MPNFQYNLQPTVIMPTWSSNVHLLFVSLCVHYIVVFNHSTEIITKQKHNTYIDIDNRHFICTTIKRRYLMYWSRRVSVIWILRYYVNTSYIKIEEPRSQCKSSDHYKFVRSCSIQLFDIFDYKDTEQNCIVTQNAWFAKW